MWDFMRFALALLALVLLGGCGDIRIVRGRTVEVTQKNAFTYVKSYKIGQKQSVYIGDPLIRVEKYLLKTSTSAPVLMMSPETDFTLEGKYIKRGLFSKSIKLNYKKDDTFNCYGSAVHNGKEYNVIGKPASDDIYDVKLYLMLTADGLLDKDIMIDDDQDRKLVAEENTMVPREVRFHPVTAAADISQSARRIDVIKELIFGGVNNVTINIAYREHTPDQLARPAFYQNLVYQTTADIIRFQAFKIKIHEITNEKVTFTVLEDGLEEPDSPPGHLE